MCHMDKMYGAFPRRRRDRTAPHQDQSQTDMKDTIRHPLRKYALFHEERVAECSARDQFAARGWLLNEIVNFSLGGCFVEWLEDFGLVL